MSDKENAFNRLCAIILAKLVDEDRGETDILDFQWFPDKDAPEELIDRLQRLYKRGMKDSLGEEITYFEERDIDNAFMAHRRDMARNEVKKIFRALKFYTLIMTLLLRRCITASFSSKTRKWSARS
ncbi:MAG: hypothetical protein KDJ31_06315 [Candidatus Competibacteraceae bacterium]|nr:hypothetical protein [Candidatus Competibacteraceae bacterium]